MCFILLKLFVVQASNEDIMYMRKQLTAWADVDSIKFNFLLSHYKSGIESGTKTDGCFISPAVYGKVHDFRPYDTNYSLLIEHFESVSQSEGKYKEIIEFIYTLKEQKLYLYLIPLIVEVVTVQRLHVAVIVQVNFSNDVQETHL